MSKATETFKAASKAVLAALTTFVKHDTSLAQAIASLYAIGFLNRMSRKDINAEGREACGATEEQWKVTGEYLSMAHRAIAGEYGFGEWLAQQWARNDFSVLTLRAAYDKTAAPKTIPDVVEQLAKKLAALSSQDQQTVLTRALEISETLAYARSGVESTIAANIAEVISATVPPASKVGAMKVA